jgi:16S rRNA (guanine966-N2)-methyltransferase
MLRLISGRHGGRRIAAPAGDFARPTTERVREALFSSLESRGVIAGARVLDGCAGSGALGLEALSRGAAHVTFFDSSRRAVNIVTENIAVLKEEAACKVIQADVTNPPKATSACSLVFLDAPYHSDIASCALPALQDAGWLANGALIVIENERGGDLVLPKGFSETSGRHYGATELHFVVFDAKA